MDIVVIFHCLEKLGGTSSFFIAQLRKALGEITKFARDNGPSIRGQPVRNGAQVGTFRNETRASCAFRNIVVLLMRKWFDILRTGFYRGCFNVRGRVRMMGFDQAGVVEEKLVTAGSAELAASLKKHTNFRRG